ncbi:CLUMA_CG012615, isoform A [Clunio marinus]|uniref:CLUMA_CG012615, isoform A n=1 Tax=Clunio marinus TaxID=568069 RepID=A0A1J1IGE7_9DIPT|nr:CLUMA_CG012615, isoform A [Clunio marinus]
MNGMSLTPVMRKIMLLVLKTTTYAGLIFFLGNSMLNEVEVYDDCFMTHELEFRADENLLMLLVI